MNYLEDGLEQLEIKGELKEKVLPSLKKYISLLQEYNAKFDLINTDDYDEICVMHILDSLSAIQILRNKIEEKKASGVSESDILCADIGSGSGLPGIPLSICFNHLFPQLKIVLVERMEKRCAFLNTCISEIGIKNVTVEEDQAERLNQKRFDLCFFRAFRPLEKKMMKVLLRILKDNGELAAYKAKSDKIKEEMDALQANCPEYKILPLKVPFLTENSISKDGENRERNLVLMKRK